MKRIMFVFALTLSAMGLAAQEYKPMLVDGREWVIGRTYMLENPDTTYITVKCVGDTIVGGKSCKKIYGSGETDMGTGIVLSFISYEDVTERKLYEWVDIIDEPFDPSNPIIHKEFRVRFDFNITDYDNYKHTAVTTDSILVKDVKYKRITYPGFEHGSHPRVVEGIGSRYEYFADDENIYGETPTDGSYFFLSKVIDDGEVIFEKDDFDAPAIKHEPVLRDGAKWECLAHNSFYGYRNVYAPFTLTLSGTSIINGKTYNDCYMEFTGKGTEKERIPFAHLREDGYKVYCLLDGAAFSNTSFSNLYGINEWWQNSGAWETVTDGENPREYVLYDFQNPMNIESVTSVYLDECVWDVASEMVNGHSCSRFDLKEQMVYGEEFPVLSMLESIGFSKFRNGGLPVFAIQDMTANNEYQDAFTLRRIDSDNTYEIEPVTDAEEAAYLKNIVPGYTYQPLIDENAELSYRYVADSKATSEAVCYKLRMHGTTEIGGKTYTNVYRFDTEDFVPESLTPRAFIREEGTKIYRRWNPEYVAQVFDEALVEEELAASPSNDDVLLYDFSDVNSTEALGHFPNGEYVIAYTGVGKEYCELPGEKNGLALVDRVGVCGINCGDLLCPMPLKDGHASFGYRIDVTTPTNIPKYYSWYYIANIANWKFAGIDGVQAGSKKGVAEWYDLRGVRLAEKPTTAGIYIVRYTNGTTKKVVVR